MLRTVLFSIVLVLGPADLLAQEQDKTPSKELTQYVRDAQKAGLKDDQIQQNAVKSGWPEGLVKEVMDSVRGTPKASPGTSICRLQRHRSRRRPRPRRPHRKVQRQPRQSSSRGA